MQEHATRVGMPYVSNRWLGGLLTNWRTISERIAYLHDLRRLQTEGQLDLLPSKERIALDGRAREARVEPRRRRRHEAPARRGLRHRPEEGAARGARGTPPGRADHRPRGHERRPGRGRLRHPRERRRDPRRPTSSRRSSPTASRPGRRQVTPAEFAQRRAEDDAAPDERPRPRPSQPRETRGRRRQPSPEHRGREPASPSPPRSPKRRRDPVSTTISASLVKELRDRTGAGMMDCKRALEETGGDLEAARTLLRERGMASAGQAGGARDDRGARRLHRRGPGRLDRRASAARRSRVSKNEEFQGFAERVLRAVHAEGPERRRALRGGARRSSSPSSARTS